MERRAACAEAPPAEPDGPRVRFFASAAKGTEDVLAEELSGLGLARVRMGSGGVSFEGSRRDGWRVCLHSAIAQRVLLLLGEFPAANAGELHANALRLPFERFCAPSLTIAASASCSGGAIAHSGYAALKLKDAVCDRLRVHAGARPSVDRKDADVVFFLHLSRGRAQVYADMSGEPLHRRGWRVRPGAAPLRETLAAAMLRIARWRCDRPLVDPMCGSGTLPIEAARMAAGIAPGILRPRFGFERWADFTPEDARAMADLRGRARAAAHGQTPRIVASDADPGAVDAAAANARAAGVRISLRAAAIADLQPSGGPGLAIMNPPYGVRLGADAGLRRQMASALTRMRGWRVCVLAGSPELAKAVPLRPVASRTLMNGALPCDFLVYDVE